jgi:hypothetical protein
VISAYITSRSPSQVARDIERLRAKGCRSFVVRRVSDGGMLDRERLGAARYAAGLQSEVTLEEEVSSGQASPESDLPGALEATSAEVATELPVARRR